MTAELDPPMHTGRKGADPRKTLNAIIFRMRSGCRRNHFPAHLGDDSAVHRTLQRWRSVRLFPRMWELIQTRREELKGVDWEWQSADTSMGKARLRGCNWPKPHRPRQARNQPQYPCRGEWKASERRGGGRERTRPQALEATLESEVAERPAPTERSPQHLCLDKGYDNPTGHQTVARHGYQPHIRRIGEEKLDARGNKRYPARRWVVERTPGWLSKRRGIVVRYEKKSENYLAMLQPACALLWYRHWWNLRF